MASCGDDFTFTWKIEDFSCLPHETGDRLTSANFIVDSLKKSKWCLWLYPRGYDWNDDGNPRVSVFLCNLEKCPIPLYYTISLETTDKVLNVQTWDTEKKAFPVGFYFYGENNIILLSSLYENKHLYLPQDVLTVKCRLSPTTENYKMPIYTKPSIVHGLFQEQCYTITRIVQKKSLTWPIKKITKHLKYRKSTTVSLNGVINSTPSLKLTFSIDENSSEGCCAQIEIVLTDSSTKEKRHFVKCKMVIITGDKKYQDSIEDTHLFNLQQDDKWIIPPFIKISNLTEGKYLYVYDTLVLECDFALSCIDTEYHIEVHQYAPWCLVGNNASRNQLGGSICHLYKNEDLCDVSLHAGGRTFPAHRLVLCARSPVFSAMFQNDMKEKDTNDVDITDVDAETLERFLRFLYSDIVDEELTFEETSSLYEVADKYEIDLLKQQCSILLLSTLSVSNVCDMIILADTHQDHFLMSIVNNFLQYHLKETLNSIQWKNFMDRDPILSGIVMFKAWQSKLSL